MGNLAFKVLQAVISKEQNSPWYLTKNMVSNISFRRYKTQWGSVYKHCNSSQYFLANPRQSIQNLLQNLEIIQNCLVSSFWIIFDTQVLFHITRYVPPAEKWKSQAQNHIYTSVGRFFDFSKNTSFGYLKKNQNQGTGWFWVLKNIRIKKNTGLGISNPSKKHQYSWKNSWFFLSSLTLKKKPVWSQGQVSRFVFCQVDSGASVFTNWTPWFYIYMHI